MPYISYPTPSTTRRSEKNIIKLRDDTSSMVCRAGLNAVKLKTADPGYTLAYLLLEQSS